MIPFSTVLQHWNWSETCHAPLTLFSPIPAIADASISHSVKSFSVVFLFLPRCQNRHLSDSFQESPVLRYNIWRSPRIHNSCDLKRLFFPAEVESGDSDFGDRDRGAPGENALTEWGEVSVTERESVTDGEDELLEELVEVTQAVNAPRTSERQ